MKKLFVLLFILSAFVLPAVFPAQAGAAACESLMVLEGRTDIGSCFCGSGWQLERLEGVMPNCIAIFRCHDVVSQGDRVTTNGETVICEERW